MPRKPSCCYPIGWTPTLYEEDDFLDEAKSYLARRGTELHVLVESEIDPQHKPLDLLRKRRDKVTVKHVPSDV